MKRKLLIACLVMVFLLGISTMAVDAAEKKVSVKIPGFSVYLNGTKVDSWHRQYPLIVYNDITYFPMTYHDSRFLGIETRWQPETGLVIEKTDITAAFREDYRKTKNSASYTATVPTFPVKVNGKAIDNTKEEYPLLLFRDITYFPLTWRFAVEEFGWEYSFDAREGLKITADNKKVQAVTLPNYQGQGLMVMGENYVYQGKDGMVFIASRTNPDKARKIYQLPHPWPDESIFSLARFYKDNGEYFMSYHTGGATMGTDHYYKIKSDGQLEKVLGGNNYSTSKFFKNMQIIVQQGVPPYPNNLVVFDGKETKNIGNPDYIYGWASMSNGAVSHSRDIYLVGDDLYLLAYNGTKEKDHSKVYRVNLNTNVFSLASPIDANRFVIEDNEIYLAKDNKLYKTDITGREPRLLTDNMANFNGFQVLKGQVYYINKNDQKLYRLGSDIPLNEKGKVTSLTRQEQFIIAVFEEEAENRYRFMVFDAKGDCVFKTSDVPGAVSIDNDRMAYSIDDSGKVYSINLK
ncbi:MAG: hypothetical protein GXW85_01715 [Clostridia bacterium]|nr:hypothetical protein [Clostridia bacterium]